MGMRCMRLRCRCLPPGSHWESRGSRRRRRGRRRSRGGSSSLGCGGSGRRRLCRCSSDVGARDIPSATGLGRRLEQQQLIHGRRVSGVRRLVSSRRGGVRVRKRNCASSEEVGGVLVGGRVHMDVRNRGGFGGGGVQADVDEVSERGRRVVDAVGRFRHQLLRTCDDDAGVLVICTDFTL